MDKRICIDEFLDYGGNELFSTLMSGDMQRSEGIDRLVRLLQIYSDRCGQIKGRSAAYRFMVSRADKNGWLGRGSGDLKSHRLTRKERGYIAKKLDKYISSGGRNSRVFKKLIGIGAVIIAVGIFVFAIVRYMKSEEYQRMLSGYFKEQIIIENIEHTADVISFRIKTSKEVEGFVYLEHLPKLYYVTSEDEIELTVVPENDIHDIITQHGHDTEYASDPRSMYSQGEQELKLTKEDYGRGFLSGEYKVVCSFYIYDSKNRKQYFPKLTERVTVE